VREYNAIAGKYLLAMDSQDLKMVSAKIDSLESFLQSFAEEMHEDLEVEKKEEKREEKKSENKVDAPKK
jgi:hypothetical protein